GLGRVQLEIITQDIEQRSVRLGRDRAARAIHLEADGHDLGSSKKSASDYRANSQGPTNLTRANTGDTPCRLSCQSVPRAWGRARQLLEQQFLPSHLVPLLRSLHGGGGATGIHGHQPPDEP